MDSSGSGRQGAHDRTSHPATSVTSPATTSPTLTQSTSNDASLSISPPVPSTPPPRNLRTRSRYSDAGRVPLHRRGTSKTYERLEDLLREAGYKETRIFTPETERTIESSAEAKGDAGSNVRSSVGAVVGFIAGLMPGASTNSSMASTVQSGSDERVRNEDAEELARIYSPPASPLSRKPLLGQQKPTYSGEPSSSPSLMTSSIESLEPASAAAPSHRTSRITNPASATFAQAQARAQRQPPQRQTRPPPFIHRVSDFDAESTYNPSARSSAYHYRQQGLLLSANSNAGEYPRPSRAGAYLRHIASTPSMSKRPSSAVSHRKTYLLNDSDPDQPYENVAERQPPLPKTWLENVARAVLFGGFGTYVGGPTGNANRSANAQLQTSSSSPQGKALRPSRSSLSQASSSARYARPNLYRSGLSDQTNTRKPVSGNALLSPPELFIRLERGRAGKSTGEVCLTRVVCRSAPASRSGSRARSENYTYTGASREKKEREHRGGEDRRKEKRKRDGGKRDRLPTLANTKTEGDAWAKGRAHRRGLKPKSAASSASAPRNRYLSGWGVEPLSDSEEGDSDASGSDDDRLSSSEDELNLAQILVPPKRQNSIRSLRKHLAADDPMVAAHSASYYHAYATTSLSRASAASRLGRQPTAGRSSSTTGGGGGDARSVLASRSGSLRKRMGPPADGDESYLDGSEAEEWGAGWVRGGLPRRNSGEDDDESYYSVDFFGERERGPRAVRGGSRTGSERSAAGKMRLGIPAWGFIGGGGS